MAGVQLSTSNRSQQCRRRGVTFVRGGKFIFLALLWPVGLPLYALGQVRKPLPPVTPPRQITQTNLRLLLDKATRELERENYREAKSLFRQGLKHARSTQNTFCTAAFLDGLGAIHNQEEQLKEALDDMEAAWKLFQNMPPSREAARCLSGLGVVYDKLGEYDKAIEYHQEALKQRKRLGNNVEKAHSLLNLGNAYGHRAEYDKAIEYLEEAWEIYRKQVNTNVNVRNKAKCCLAIGNCYINQGSAANARSWYADALDLQTQRGDSRGRAKALLNIGHCLQEEKKFAEARNCYLKAHELFQKLSDKQNLARCLVSLADIEGDYIVALEYYGRARQLFQKTKNRTDISWHSYHTGRFYESNGHLEEAKKEYDGAASGFEFLKDDEGRGAVAHALGRLLRHFRQRKQALKKFVEAKRYFEQRRTQITNPTRIGDYQQRLGAFYAEYARLCVEDGNPHQALVIFEEGRMQGLFLQALLNANVFMGDTLSPQERNDFLSKKLAWEISANQWERARNHRGNGKVADRAFQDAEKQYWQSDKEFRLQQDRFFAKLSPLTAKESLNLPHLVGNLKHYPDTVLLEWIIVDRETTLLFALDSNGKLQHWILSHGEDQWRDLINTWLKAIDGRGSRGGNSIEASAPDETRRQDERSCARKLYDSLFGTLEKDAPELLQGSKRLIILADGPLLNLSFAALLDSDNKRLVERFPISYLLSLRDLSVPAGARARKSLLCVATPTGNRRFPELPFTQTEAQQISSLFSDPSVYIDFPNAREAAVKQAMPLYRILHFAVHGEFSAHNVLRSRLVLAQEEGKKQAGMLKTAGEPEGDREDGMLEAQEIVAQPLGAEMTVLSACETSLGAHRSGEGMMSLVWAFRAAGCPSVVSSLWRVHDENTARLMIAFYRHLNEKSADGQGKRVPKDVALQAAMLAVMRAKPETASPYYWAAFQLIGDRSPIEIHAKE